MNTFVNLIIIGLAIYALITAIRAVKQVQKQRQVNADYQPKQNERVDSQDALKTAAPVSQPELQEPISTDSEPVSEPAFSEMTGTVDASVPSAPTEMTEISDASLEPVASQVSSGMDANTGAVVQASGEDVGEKANNLGEVIPNAEVDVPLAASLPVRDVVNSEQTDVAAMPTATEDLGDLTGNEFGEDVQTGEGSQRDRQSILDEIADLGRTDQEDALSHFMEYTNHSDRAVQVAAIFELGELAAKRQGQSVEEVVQRLRQLSESDDPAVRSQAMVALGKIQPISFVTEYGSEQ